jgi:hypothetical protein
MCLVESAVDEIGTYSGQQLLLPNCVLAGQQLM